MTDSLLDIWSMRKRGKTDAHRHLERIKKAIKENLRELVSDSSIISSDGKRKIKIPIRYLDNYRFIYQDDKNKEHVGQGNKDSKPGDVIGHDGTGGKGKGKQADDSPGDDVFEQELSLDDIIDMMLEDLGLPWLERKEEAIEIETEDIEFNDISEIGPLSNVDKRRTIYENMKRNAKLGKAQIKGIKPEDLRYKVWDKKKEFHSNAAVYLLMDRSGSMDDDKKYICKAFFFWLVHFCKTKYNNVDIVFISHDTTAKIDTEENFFTRSNSGGTMCSSAFELALSHIKENHPSDIYNNYVFAFSDGDNWSDDNKKCIKIVKELLEHVTAIGYGEVNLNDNGFSGSWSTLHDEFDREVKHERFMTAKISGKEDIYECLKKFLGIKEESK